MSRITHDVAISAVAFESILVGDLAGRVRKRLAAPHFWRAEGTLGGFDAVTDTVAADVIGDSARVVVVLHQRLWGRDVPTAADAVALRQRVKNRRHKSIVVVTLDDAPVPDWLRKATIRSVADVGIEGVANGVIDIVVKCDGAARAAPAAPLVVKAPPRPAWSDPPQTYMTQPRALTALRHEFEAMTTELTQRMRVESDRLGEVKFELHSAPHRLVVQLGIVGLSISWMAARSGKLVDGRLLVIEWEGEVAHGRSMGGTKTASPMREQLFRPDATGPDNWCWRPEGPDGSAYSSRNLAGQWFAGAALAREA